MDVLFPKPGKYVVAVSGGVDSMALLDVLAKRPGLELVVAHFDHGIRPDSPLDSQLVTKIANRHGLKFVSHEGKLGPGTSEAVARDARYKFLKKVVNENSALAIITAHHQDDLLETAVLNILRGTGRKGLTSLASNSEIIRPLLNVPKADLIKYAQVHELEWREDSTNADTSYLRNYIRHNILSQFKEKDKKNLIKKLNELKDTNQELDKLLNEILINQIVEGKVSRQWFSQLPHSLAKEFMASWLRQEGVREFDTGTLERLTVGAKTAAPGKQIDAVKGYKLAVNKYNLALKGPER
jgi:tRNA(Ile)-lysidine synthetase-like protein